MIPSQELQQRNRPVREKLLSELKSGNAILMAGAGCSVEIGYPGWRKLIQDMAAELTPGIVLTANDVKLDAQAIWTECVKRHKNAERFERFLYNQFSPKGNAYLDFHLDLMKLPFAGLTTTNYNLTLEFALGAAFSNEHAGCETVNLCVEDTRHRVLDFFRELGSKNRVRHRVLHIHGTHDRPKNIVLTLNDYERFYNGGIPKEDGTFEKPLIPVYSGP